MSFCFVLVYLPISLTPILRKYKNLESIFYKLITEKIHMKTGLLERTHIQKRFIILILQAVTY